jgi:hypothetical protein
MWPAVPGSQIDERPAGISPSALVDKYSQLRFSQRWPNYQIPLITTRIRVFGVNILSRLNQTAFNIFQAVGFLADEFDIANSNPPAI